MPEAFPLAEADATGRALDADGDTEMNTTDTGVPSPSANSLAAPADDEEAVEDKGDNAMPDGAGEEMEEDVYEQSEIGQRLAALGLARGYMAMFCWKDHYPGLDDDEIEDLVAYTEMHANLPALFHGIIEGLQRARLKEGAVPHGDMPLSKFDKKLVRPYSDDIPSAEARYRIILEDGQDWVVIANRKEHMRLLYDELTNVGHCPYVFAIYGSTSGKAFLGVDPRNLLCTCDPPRECSWVVPNGPDPYLDKKFSSKHLSKEGEAAAAAAAALAESRAVKYDEDYIQDRQQVPEDTYNEDIGEEADASYGVKRSSRAKGKKASKRQKTTASSTVPGGEIEDQASQGSEHNSALPTFGAGKFQLYFSTFVILF
jgi:hypothetical protein